MRALDIAASLGFDGHGEVFQIHDYAYPPVDSPHRPAAHQADSNQYATSGRPENHATQQPTNGSPFSLAAALTTTGTTRPGHPQTATPPARTSYPAHTQQHHTPRR